MRIPGFILVFLLLFAFVSCKHPAAGVSRDNCSEGRFHLTEYQTYQKLVVKDPWQGSSSVEFDYYLFPETAVVPDSLKSKTIIRVPIHRIVCMSTTHLSMICALKEDDAIVGISGKNLVYNPDLRRKLDEGVIKDVGYESNLDKELIVSLKPDILMAYGVNPASVAYMTKLNDLGIKVMFNADYLEQDPLKRAEWIKVFGALFERKKMADSIYETVCNNYNRVKDTVLAHTDNKPVVLLGGPWENVWYIAPSGTYVTRLLSDAGAEYLFADFKAEHAKPLSVEAVFVRAENAGIWLNPGAARSLEELYGY
ncbi:MAG TPA: ABC transporter substrate-binding protein, partial [Bacteroidales bacterium]|nr:ABC transporter substrate-binding protein [Bacteroidales bacterium]